MTSTVADEAAAPKLLPTLNTLHCVIVAISSFPNPTAKLTTWSEISISSAAPVVTSNISTTVGCFSFTCTTQTASLSLLGAGTEKSLEAVSPA